VVADPPTAWLMAVVPLHDLLHAGAVRADDAELGDIRAESRPEPVVRTRFIHRAGMHRKPVIDNGRIFNVQATIPAAAANNRPPTAITPHLISQLLPLGNTPTATTAQPRAAGPSLTCSQVPSLTTHGTDYASWSSRRGRWASPRSKPMLHSARSRYRRAPGTVRRLQLPSRELPLSVETDHIASAMPATAVMVIPIRTLSWIAVGPFSAGFSRKALPRS
jgi:hypothetical protein